MLGLPSKESALTYLQHKLDDKLLLLDWKCILINWVKDNPPTVTLWYRELLRVIPHERVAAILGGNEDLLLNVTPLLTYFPDDLSQLLRGAGCLLGVSR